MRHIRTDLLILLLLASPAFPQSVRDDAATLKQLAGAIERNPNKPGLQSQYGEALLRTGDADAATEAFENALKSDSEDTRANLGLGQILVVRKQFARAQPLFERALVSRPQSNEAKLGLAQCLVAQKNFQKALPYLEPLVANMPNSADAHLTLAGAYAGLGRTEEANGERDLARSLEDARKAAEPGPKLHEVAPDFTLPDSVSGQPVRLRDFRGKTPVVLIFGSYSCPNFRWAADALKSMGREYGSHVHFTMVYIREAHADGDWQSTRNIREGISIAAAANIEQKTDHAKMCSRELHLPFPALVDGLDGVVENAYAAWPSRAFIVAKDGRVQYSTRLTEFDFHRDEMESVLRALLR